MISVSPLLAGMKILFGLLLVLSQLSGISVAAQDSTISADNSCRVHAWVHAPDFEPGQVVQGDVKIKLDGACEEVLSYTLRLCFTECAWVKTRCLSCYHQTLYT